MTFPLQEKIITILHIEILTFYVWILNGTFSAALNLIFTLYMNFHVSSIRVYIYNNKGLSNPRLTPSWGLVQFFNYLMNPQICTKSRNLMIWYLFHDNIVFTTCMHRNNYLIYNLSLDIKTHFWWKYVAIKSFYWHEYSRRNSLLKAI